MASSYLGQEDKDNKDRFKGAARGKPNEYGKALFNFEGLLNSAKEYITKKKENPCDSLDYYRNYYNENKSKNR